MVPTVKEILFSRIFPAQSIQDLRITNQDECEKAYHIYSTYNQLFAFL